MTLDEVMSELEKLGTEQTRKTWLNHGAKGEIFGVKIGDMKPIQKKIKPNQELASALYNTGNSDAMYFAGLISEPQKMTKKELQDWAKKSQLVDAQRIYGTLGSGRKQIRTGTGDGVDRFKK